MVFCWCVFHTSSQIVVWHNTSDFSGCLLSIIRVNFECLINILRYLMRILLQSVAVITSSIRLIKRSISWLFYFWCFKSFRKIGIRITKLCQIQPNHWLLWVLISWIGFHPIRCPSAFCAAIFGHVEIGIKWLPFAGHVICVCISLCTGIILHGERLGRRHIIVVGVSAWLGQLLL